ncbi:AAA family ATPase [Halobaculum sp. MBLA0147]|uniref:hypothetical protein n=1 Tax=Halobaculum sp. MBLA0147 TaxID=3079934 RepID=UPI003523CBE6
MPTEQLQVQNIAGIESASTGVTPGLNALQAPNWSGKSSFVKALRVIYGGYEPDELSSFLTNGKAEGTVQFGDAAVKLYQRDGTVDGVGNHRVSDEAGQEMIRLFAMISRDNPLRAAVAAGDTDLLEYLLNPLDIQDLDEQIATTEDRIETLEQQVAEAREANERLAPLESEIAATKSELEALRDQQDQQTDLNIADIKQELSRLTDRRDTKESRIAEIEARIDQREQKLADLRDKLADHTVPDEPDPEFDPDAIQTTIDSLRAKREDLTGVQEAITGLRSDADNELAEHLPDSHSGCLLCGDDDAPLLPDTTGLSTAVNALDDQIADLETALDDYKTAQEAYENAQERHSTLTASIEESERELEQDQGALTEAEDDLADLNAEIEELEDKVASHSDSDIADTAAKITKLESTLADLEEEKQDVDDKVSQLETLEADLDNAQTRLQQLQNRRTQIINSFCEEFSDAITELQTIFEPNFENAQFHTQHADGDQDAEITGLNLVVTRNGTTLSPTDLSESERTLLAIMVCLAGRRAYDVADYADVIVVDDVGELSGHHLHALADYLADHATYAFITGTPETEDLGETVPDVNHLSPDRWATVSAESPV